ncbi:hypothetical protein RO3G_08167 [Rhizopus delemar RA 99-880]|uniref:Uncharacterized protein n=1 Tax=Rhizopus delemar (strain RA 99-880 / ATCC MYA-4621 / FGSC 9543 / NRRL 43880) TaxID=246409 RepID=I1C4T2_RHIO9|nr:hypothetical protein RO3G_08167 [Rhizopus delemar RA 99-880]|eukprot:EIE83462.1 hypothetical protein RO3G_08167 [Rhizopus delemar RA 99-880]
MSLFNPLDHLDAFVVIFDSESQFIKEHTPTIQMSTQHIQHHTYSKARSHLPTW